MALIIPPLSVGSVQATAGRPLRARAAETAVRSSLICVALMTVVPATSGLSLNAFGLVLNVAVVARAAVIETVQVFVVPVHAPLQPAKSELPVAAAVKVTMAPLVSDVEQTVPQSMPAGELVTVPLPVPALVTVNANDGSENVAVTDRAALIATVHVDVVPVQLPVQPPKMEPPDGAAVNVTVVPLVYEAEHVVPQLMPAGELVTVPPPLPDLVTVRAKVGAVNVAVTDVAVLTVTVQAPVPEQPPPLQPPNVEPVAAAAVSVTGVPFV
jgi:hypothetical protein